MKSLKVSIYLYMCLSVGVLYGDNILLIGDSISLGYQYRAKLYAAPRHNIVHPEENALTSTYCKEHVAEWLSMTNTVWDVVHFNVGLHDIYRFPDNTYSPTVSIELYQENLLAIVEIIQKHSPCAIIVFALTTPILSQPNRLPEDVDLYNSAATNILLKSGVYINDLYSLVYPHLDEYLLPDRIHYLPEGNQFNAENVVDYIDSIPEPVPCLYTEGQWGRFVVKTNHIYSVSHCVDLCADEWQLVETNITGVGNVHSFRIGEEGFSSGCYRIGSSNAF